MSCTIRILFITLSPLVETESIIQTDSSLIELRSMMEMSFKIYVPLQLISTQWFLLWKKESIKE